MSDNEETGFFSIFRSTQLLMAFVHSGHFSSAMSRTASFVWVAMRNLMTDSTPKSSLVEISSNVTMETEEGRLRFLSWSQQRDKHNHMTKVAFL